MPDVGLTHIALPVTNLAASLKFYETYANLHVVHQRQKHSDPSRGVAWISDATRPFAVVLLEMPTVDHPLRPSAHLGVACESRQIMDELCDLAQTEGVLLQEPTDSGPPVGYWALIQDPDGHTLELSFGQEVKLAVERG